MFSEEAINRGKALSILSLVKKVSNMVKLALGHVNIIFGS